MAEKIPLKDRSCLTIPEALLLTGWSRGKLIEKLDSGQIDWFEDGKRRKVVGKSLAQHIDNETQKTRQAFGLKTA